MQESPKLTQKLQNYSANYPCLIEIGEHGYTHAGDEYKMDILEYERQK